MTIKELKIEAKAMGIVGYSKMNKGQLMDAIGSVRQQAASEASRKQQHNNDDLINGHQQSQDDFFTPDPQMDVVPVQQVQRAANEVSGKIIEFVKADNTQVCFFAKGKKVRVYWDTTTYKLTMHSERKGRRAVKYAELIRMFKPFTNGVHGDVAQVVKAIVRIKDMPAAIKVHRHNKLVAEGRVTPSQRTKENATTSKRTQGKVDPQWMQRLTEWFLETEGRRPTGLEIRNEWIAEQEQRRA